VVDSEATSFVVLILGVSCLAQDVASSANESRSAGDARELDRSKRN